MNWINDTILIMGGMQACGLTLETPTEVTTTEASTAGTFTANI